MKTEKICERNCPDYTGMQILHIEQCNCSCHSYKCNLPPGQHIKECNGNCSLVWSLQDFKDGKVRIDFRNYSVADLKQLRNICELVNPKRDVPAYSFGNCYYIENDRWYEGGTHNFVGHDTCRATDISLKRSLKC